MGKSIRDFEKGDWEELEERLEGAGGDIEKFNARLESLEPEARNLGEAITETLEELFPAAAERVKSGRVNIRRYWPMQDIRDVIEAA